MWVSAGERLCLSETSEPPAVAFGVGADQTPEQRSGGTHNSRVLSPHAALNMTSASSFQMLRGSVIIFTGLLSVAFLGRKLELSQWLGILVTIVGLVVVGLADLHSSHDQKHKLSEVITGMWWPCWVAAGK